MTETNKNWSEYHAVCQVGGQVFPLKKDKRWLVMVVSEKGMNNDLTFNA